MIVDVRREAGCWSVYVDGRRMVDRESFAVADRIRLALLGQDDVTGECVEVARSIRRWLGATRGDNNA